eukprot:CAMPEP_0174290746 /NCGR_PEP_ID=MMETSP0809-20121228/29971_1 /TAXON_ID=73025 ORGANISM="Eutreptiella gymnastica-like, Strain CCMP1594" /NCGR_SAMPLE_ID=MMETSP0809 /ASSEMBLY_ACC=CAM_ASM_000658 /LENGTH=99 /DNA_ID=CAMNT_0015389637 /DNA_START=808 /DNA_END=1108 /DNA_ORIENTATION=-
MTPVGNPHCLNVQGHLQSRMTQHVTSLGTVTAGSFGDIQAFPPTVMVPLMPSEQPMSCIVQYGLPTVWRVAPSRKLPTLSLACQPVERKAKDSASLEIV